MASVQVDSPQSEEVSSHAEDQTVKKQPVQNYETDKPEIEDEDEPEDLDINIPDNIIDDKEGEEEDDDDDDKVVLDDDDEDKEDLIANSQFYDEGAPAKKSTGITEFSDEDDE